MPCSNLMASCHDVVTLRSHNASMRAPRKPYDIILLDWDGTLVDSDQLSIAIWEKTFEDFNIEFTPVARKECTFLAPEELIAKYFVEKNAKEVTETLSTNAKAMEQGFNNGKPLLKDGAEAFLDYLQKLRKNHGVSVAVVSNRPHESLKRHVQALEWEGKFDHFIGTVKDAPHKPNPKTFERVLNQLGLDTSEYIPNNEGIEFIKDKWKNQNRILMVGDSLSDFKFAYHLGAKFIAVGERQDLKDHMNKNTFAIRMICAPEHLENLTNLQTHLEALFKNTKRQDTHAGYGR